MFEVRFRGGSGCSGVKTKTVPRPTRLPLELLKAGSRERAPVMSIFPCFGKVEIERRNKLWRFVVPHMHVIRSWRREERESGAIDGIIIYKHKRS